MRAMIMAPLVAALGFRPDGLRDLRRRRGAAAPRDRRDRRAAAGDAADSARDPGALPVVRSQNVAVRVLEMGGTT